MRTFANSQIWFRFCLTALLSTVSVFAVSAQQTNEVQKLFLNQPLERAIKGGETHSFEFNVKAGFYARAEVEQKNIDVVASLFAPDGKLMVEMDGKDGNLWRLTVSCIAETDGVYRIEVNGQGTAEQSGSYKLRLVELSSSTPDDQKQLAAEASLSAGIKFVLQRNYVDAVRKFEEAAKLFHTLSDDEQEAVTLVNAGWAYRSLSKYPLAIENHKRALELFQKTKNRAGEGKAANGLGLAYGDYNQSGSAIDYFQKALTIRREIGDRSGEGGTLNNLGSVYNDLAQFNKAVGYFEQALVIARETKKRRIEGFILNNLGNAYDGLAQFEKARNSYEQALFIIKEIKDISSEPGILNNVGNSHFQLAQYDKARDYFQQSLLKSEDDAQRSPPLTGLGNVYYFLGQYDKSLEYFEQSLKITREIVDKSGESQNLHGIGGVYQKLRQYEKARDHYEKALVITKKIADRYNEALILISLGNFYQALAQYERTTEYFEQNLAITKEIKDRDGESDALINLGLVYTNLNQYEKARKSYMQALLIKKEIKDLSGEAAVYLNLTVLWEKLKNRELAIIFGKQGVAAYQKIRGNIKRLDKESQKSYLNKNIQIYRLLSDILISEGRFVEAQAILDLLKDKEYEQLTRGGENEETIPYSQAEAEVIAKIENLVALERERGELQKLLSANGELSAEQNNKLAKLNLDIAAANKAFDNALDALGKAEASATTRVDEIKGGKVLQSALSELGEKTNSGVVALYTVLGTEEEKDAGDKPVKDKLKSKFGWVIMVTENRYTAYPIDVKNLEETVFQFREALSSDKYNPQPLAEKIYTAIFRQTSPKLKKTLEQDLQEYLKSHKDKTLMWSLDGVLRYIPMAALHDGKQYLVENYRSTVFTKESFLWLMNSYENNWKALGLGVSEKRGTFSELPGVKTELETIVRESGRQTGILNGSIKLNDNFKKQAFFNIINAGGFPVVHISSHYNFDSGKPENSFLLAGDGNLTFAEIKEKQNLFKKVDLLTLSACDTGVSGNGKEAEGFAYLAQSLGAKSVIASLWKVSDAGTPQLMIRFYKLRSEHPEMSKGEAFRQAQLSLLSGDAKQNKEGIDKSRRAEIVGSNSSELKLPLFVIDKQNPYAHPHYWSSFVLIGNWR